MTKVDFKPMPKRFIVWDTWHDEWLHPYGSLDNDEPYIFDLYEMLCRLDLVKLSVKDGVYKICQSTNLFDKDGKEIFEGSIVRGQVFDSPKTRIVGIVVYRQQAFWIINVEETHSEPLLKFYEKEVEIIGHILSNPELLEEKDV